MGFCAWRQSKSAEASIEQADLGLRVYGLGSKVEGTGYFGLRVLPVFFFFCLFSGLQVLCQHYGCFVTVGLTVQRAATQVQPDSFGLRFSVSVALVIPQAKKRP